MVLSTTTKGIDNVISNFDFDLIELHLDDVLGVLLGVEVEFLTFKTCI